MELNWPRYTRGRNAIKFLLIVSAFLTAEACKWPVVTQLYVLRRQLLEVCNQCAVWWFVRGVEKGFAAVMWHRGRADSCLCCSQSCRRTSPVVWFAQREISSNYSPLSHSLCLSAPFHVLSSQSASTSLCWSRKDNTCVPVFQFEFPAKSCTPCNHTALLISGSFLSVEILVQAGLKTLRLSSTLPMLEPLGAKPQTPRLK